MDITMGFAQIRKGARVKRSRKRKSPYPLMLFRLVLLCVLLGLFYASFGRQVLGKWLPSSEKKDLTEWFEVSGNRVRIYLDGEPEFEVTGTSSDGMVYLPFSYVSEHLNSRFFWSGSDHMVSYTLPRGTEDIHAEDLISGLPAFLENGDGVSLSLDLVQRYTNLTYESFCDEKTPAKRVFLNRGGSSVLTTEALKKAAVRTKAGVSAPVLTELAKGSGVVVKERSDDWSKVITDDGIPGYVQTKALAKPVETVLPDTYRQPEYFSQLYSEKVILGWHGVYNQEGNNMLDQYLQEAGSRINVISPTWIQISDEKGNYVNYSDEEYIRKAHEAGLKVWACVDNFNQTGGFKDFSTKTYFASAASRRDFIDRLMKDAERYGYDGINLDFESLPADAGESYTQFFRELSVECHKAGIVLSIDNYVPYGFNDFYNLDEQGVFADYTVIMLYNEHTYEAGSVASLPYTQYGITETKKEVPSERVIAALPLYTRVWSVKGGETTSESMGMDRSLEYLEEKGITTEWDEAAGQNYGEYTEGDTVQMIWVEDRDSVREKLAFIKQQELGGIAFWRLGYASEDFWKKLDYPGK